MKKKAPKKKIPGLRPRKVPPKASRVIRGEEGRTVVRVLGCSLPGCGNVTRWKGHEAEHAAVEGWGSWWASDPSGKLVQRWACWDCWDGRPLHVEPVYTIPASFLELAGKGDGKRSICARLLERLYEIDPPRAENYTRSICETYEKGKRGGFWEAFAEQHGQPIPEKKTTKKARPSSARGEVAA